MNWWYLIRGRCLRGRQSTSGLPSKDRAGQGKVPCGGKLARACTPGQYLGRYVGNGIGSLCSR